MAEKASDALTAVARGWMKLASTLSAIVDPAPAQPSNAALAAL
jgi:hypothetical protein